MKRNITYLAAFIALVLLAPSCKKEDKGSGVKAVFSYVPDGYKVNFTNFSTNATEYRWDFGDGSGDSSTRRDPQHIFTRKGDFLVSLTAKRGSEVSTFKDTVSIIGPNIKIDGDFSDWQYVGYLHENDAAFASSVTGVKAFASADAINFYFEGGSGMNMEIIDIYMDADNNPATGFSTWLYPGGSGADYLIEGSPVGGWGDVFKHSGAPSAFSWNSVSTFATALNFSTLRTVNGKKAIEFSIKKSVLGTLSGSVNFALIESTSGWAEVGKIPEAPTANGKFLSIQL